MQLLKDGRLAIDSWVLLQDAADVVPDTGDVIVPMQHWSTRRETLLRRSGRNGLWLSSEDEIESIAQDIAHCAVIVLEFSSSTDGRHYSNARLLRERYAYSSELRASGEVLRDQLFYLTRCGFDSFLLADDCDLEDFLRGREDFSSVYQYATDDLVPAYRRRAGAV
jgi:uncharacterized protein (DUF934 family)